MNSCLTTTSFVILAPAGIRSSARGMVKLFDQMGHQRLSKNRKIMPSRTMDPRWREDDNVLFGACT